MVTEMLIHTQNGSISEQQLGDLNYFRSSSNISQPEPAFEGNFFRWELFLQSGSLSLIVLLSLVGNFIVTFSLVRRDLLHFPSNRLVFNLTASNFAFSLFILPFSIASVVQQKWLFGIFWCNFTAFLTLLNGSASVITLAMIAIDRYYAIVKPMAYTMTITSSKSTAMLLWVWIQAFSCSLPPLFGWSKFEFQEGEYVCSVSWRENHFYTVYSLSSCVLIPFLVMITCYYFIYRVARTQSRLNVPEIEASEAGLAVVSAVQVHLDKAWSRYRKFSSSSKRQSLTLLSYQLMTKGAWTICVVLGAFVITWFPLLALAAWQCACGHSCAPPRWFRVTATWLMFASSVSYPVVYGIYNRAIRKEMWSWLCQTNAKNAMKGLPNRNSQRGSLMSSFLEYSPFRLRNQLKRSTINIRSRASIDLGILALANLALRKGSQDSGAVMSESDAENTNSGFWFRRRHSSSNVFRVHTQTSSRLPKPELVPIIHLNNESCPLPILQIISLNEGHEAGDVVIHAEEESAANQVLVVHSEEQISNQGLEESVDESDMQKQFQRQKRGASVDEGIVNDCEFDISQHYC